MERGKIYYGTSEGTFKQRYGNLKKSFNNEKHRTDTELSKEYLRLKKLKAQTQVQFYLLKRCRPTKGTRICYLCLNEKFLSLKTKETFLTQEMNLSLSEDTETNLILCTTKPDHCVENVLARKFFFCWQFFLAFGLNMEAYRVNLRSHSECGEILARACRM